MSAVATTRRLARAARAHAPTLATAAAAVGFGLLAVLGVRGHVAEQIDAERARLAPREAREPVVVAKLDLPAGAEIGPETMALRELPSEGLPASAVRPEAFDALVGSRLSAPLRAGEPLLAPLVARGDDELASRVRSGVRALTIAVDEVNALSGMLQPGDRIDLLLSARLPVAATRVAPGQDARSRTAIAADAAPGEPQDVTIPLMQDVRVLATGRQVKPQATGDEAGAARAFTAITIEATPEQAQRLVVAQRTGRLTAMLRNPGDRGEVARQPMDLPRLLGLAQPPAASGTEIIVGGRGAPERQLQLLPEAPAARVRPEPTR